MPAFGPIVIKDAATPPVAHTFSPVQISGNVASYADRLSGVAVGYPHITASMVRPSKTSRLTKVRLRCVMPVLETLGTNTVTGIVPQPTKAYDVTADLTFILPERSGLQHRQDILAFAKGMLNDAVLSQLILTNETIY